MENTSNFSRSSFQIFWDIQDTVNNIKEWISIKTEYWPVNILVGIDNIVLFFLHNRVDGKLGKVIAVLKKNSEKHSWDKIFVLDKIKEQTAYIERSWWWAENINGMIYYWCKDTMWDTIQMINKSIITGNNENRECGKKEITLLLEKIDTRLKWYIEKIQQASKEKGLNDLLNILE